MYLKAGKKKNKKKIQVTECKYITQIRAEINEIQMKQTKTEKKSWKQKVVVFFFSFLRR